MYAIKVVFSFFLLGVSAVTAFSPSLQHSSQRRVSSAVTKGGSHVAVAGKTRADIAFDKNEQEKEAEDKVSSSSTSIFSSHKNEISRRVALVLAAATVAAGGIPPPAAMAASLARVVAKIETENLADVNSKGAPEKHLPKVTVSDDDNKEVTVVVPHVMDPEKPHFIEYVWLKEEGTNKIIAVKQFQATDASPPTLIASSVKKGSTLKPLLFCNLHGLWEGEVFSV